MARAHRLGPIIGSSPAGCVPPGPDPGPAAGPTRPEHRSATTRSIRAARAPHEDEPQQQTVQALVALGPLQMPLHAFEQAPREQRRQGTQRPPLGTSSAGRTPIHRAGVGEEPRLGSKRRKSRWRPRPVPFGVCLQGLSSVSAQVPLGVGEDGPDPVADATGVDPVDDAVVEHDA